MTGRGYSLKKSHPAVPAKSHTEPLPVEEMKANVLLIANSETFSIGVVSEAAVRSGRGLQHASSSRDACQILSFGLEDIGVIIIDLEPGIHSLSILEAISYCKTAPPVIGVAGFAKSDMTFLAHRHGAAVCLNKPFNAAELASVMDDVCLAASQRRNQASAQTQSG